MRKILRIAIIIIIIVFLYLSVFGLFLLRKTKDASDRLVGAIMLVGDDTEKSCSPQITLFPPATDIANLKISSREGFINGFKWYDLNLESRKINLNLIDVFKSKFPKIRSVTGFRFAGKIPFHALALMLGNKNPDWSEIKVGHLGESGDTIYIYAKNSKNNQSVNLIGKLVVNKDGYILFYPADSKFFDSNGKLDIDAFNEARKGMELSWSFAFFDIFIPINRVAVSESGFYIEAGDIVPGGIGNPNENAPSI